MEPKDIGIVRSLREQGPTPGTATGSTPIDRGREHAGTPAAPQRSRQEKSPEPRLVIDDVANQDDWCPEGDLNPHAR